MGQQAGGPGEPVVQVKSEGILLENSLMLREAGLFSFDSGLQLIG